MLRDDGGIDSPRALKSKTVLKSEPDANENRRARTFSGLSLSSSSRLVRSGSLARSRRDPLCLYAGRAAALHRRSSLAPSSTLDLISRVSREITGTPPLKVSGIVSFRREKKTRRIRRDSKTTINYIDSS